MSSLEGEVTQLGHGVTRAKWQGGGVDRVVTFVNVPFHFNANGLFMKVVVFFMFQSWENPFLRWNPSDYGGVKFINIDPILVWKPDIVLYNR